MREGGGIPAAGSRAPGRAAALLGTLAGAFGVMMVASTLAAGLNYLFNIIMTRKLGEAGAFGEFYSLNSIFLIVSIGASSVQAAVTKYVADFGAAGESEKVRLLVRTFSRWLVLAAGVVMLLSIAVSWPLARVLKLESPLFVVILGSSIAVSLYITLPFGLLQGRQRFMSLGAGQISQAVLRILFGVLLVLVGLGVYGALGAVTLAGAVVAVTVVYFTRDAFEKPAIQVEDFHPARALAYLLPVAVTMVLIIFLTQIDVLLVKALFSRRQADVYSYGALAGKAVFFFPEGISIVMFPRVSDLKARGRPTRGVLAWSFAAAAALSGAAVAFYALFPYFTAFLFAGEKGKVVADIRGPLDIRLLVLFGMTMGLLAMLKLLAFYHLALEKKAFIWLLSAGAAAQVTGILLFHESLAGVITVVLLVALALVCVNLVLAFYEKPAPPGSGDTGKECIRASTGV